MDFVSNTELYDKMKELEDKIEILIMDKKYAGVTVLASDENFHKNIVDTMLENFLAESFAGLNSNGKHSDYYKFLKRIKDNESFVEKIKVLYLRKLEEERHYDSYLNLVIEALYDAMSREGSGEKSENIYESQNDYVI